MRQSIRWRLTAWYVLVLAATLLLLGGAAVLLMRAALYDWMDDALRDRAKSLSTRVEWAKAGRRLYLPVQPGASGGEAADGVVLLDGGGRVIQAQDADPALLTRATAVASALRGAPDVGAAPAGAHVAMRVAACPILSDGRVRAVLVVARNLGELHAVLARLMLFLLALAPIAACAAGLGGFLLASRALRPVDEITRTAAEISEADLSHRLPVRTSDELGRLATTFNSLISRVETAFDRQRRFTADASHELRTPLSVIRAITSQKLMQPRTVEEYQGALRQIHEASGYMAKLVTHLLTLARADAGQVRLERERLDLCELLRQVSAQVEEASERPIPVSASAPVMVTGDAVRLTGLFMNLLENAAKYTPEDGHVEVSALRSDGNAVVEVRDTGAGIGEEHLPHIFERFYRVDEARAREQGGSGLGLAIGRWVAEAHGGSIQVSSAPGRGTTMTVRLPLAEGKPDPTRDTDPTATAERNPSAQGSGSA